MSTVDTPVLEFLKIIGHKDVMRSLISAYHANKMSGAYLFYGNEAIGKRQVAFNFTKYINCQNKKESYPCEVCPSCIRINKGNSADIRIIEPEGKGNVIKIDQVRNMKKEFSLRPFSSNYRVCIVDDAHCIRNDAANSFLKMLEESPYGNIFFLITSSINKIIPTILSRCAVVNFNNISNQQIRDYLQSNLSVDINVAEVISKYAEGSLGKANQAVNENMIEHKNKLHKQLEKLLIGKISLSNAGWNYTDRTKLKEDLLHLLCWFRDALISKTESAQQFIQNIDREKEIFSFSKKLPTVEIERMIAKLSELYSFVDLNVNMKIIVDTLLCEISRLKLLIR